MIKDPDARAAFVIARNPEEDSKLPYLIRLPIEGGLALKAHDVWPRSARVYCHPFEEGWPPDAEVLEETPVASCRRRGAVIDLVLDRPRLARSQFVFTETRGRPAIFWQTQKTARAANPGARVPRARAIPEGFQIAIDTRERYPYRFSGKGVRTERLTLAAGDYAVGSGEGLIAVLERKVMDNFCSSLSDGTLAFQMQRLSELQAVAVVFEGRYVYAVRIRPASITQGRIEGRKIIREVVCRATATTSSRNSAGNALGMVTILPVRANPHRSGANQTLGSPLRSGPT